MPASTHPGMGALVFPGGVGFRVWAPNAPTVAVAGEFNGWSTTAHPLTGEGNGYWSTDVPGAQPGQRYKFFLAGMADPWKIDPYALEVTHSNGDAVIHNPDFDWQGDNFTLPPWHELVIYEMHVGTFNPPFVDVPGQFQGVIDRLPYLRDLGINAIEIMPAGEFPGQRSWGYNPAHIFSIEVDYGGLRGLRQLVRAAHAHGIGVILDVVYNHMGTNDLDLWRFDGWSQDGGAGIYFYNDWRARTPWGDRFDYGRGEVRQFLRDNALLWLETHRVDGLRWDATRFVHNVSGGDDPGQNLDDGWRLMQWINGEMRARLPWKLSIAEDLQHNYRITQAPNVGGAGFGAQWDQGFVQSVRRALTTPDDNARNLGAVAESIYRRYNASAFERVIYVESHDDSGKRFDEAGPWRAYLAEEVWPGNAGSWASRKRAALGAALTLTAPGIPMLLQGQEFASPGSFHDQHPLDWNWATQHAHFINLHRDLIRLRRNWFNHTRGLRGEHVNVYHLNHADKVLAMHRWAAGGGGDDVVVVLNFSARGYTDYQLGMPRSGDWRVRFNSDWSGYGSDFGNFPSYDVTAGTPGRDGLSYNGTLSLGPYTAVILSQDNF